MQLDTYLHDRGIGYAEFGRRIGITHSNPCRTVRGIAKGIDRCNLERAKLIVEATGGAVGYDDLANARPHDGPPRRKKAAVAQAVAA